MHVTTSSQARANLKEELDRVVADHDVTIITRLEQQHVVILPLAAYIEMCRTIGVKLDRPSQAVI